MRGEWDMNKVKLRPVVSIQMIENGYIVYYEGKQVHFDKLLDAWREVSSIMTNWNV